MLQILNIPGVVELTTQLLILENILWLPLCRGGRMADAMGWLKRGGGSRALVGSRGEVGMSERGMQDIPRSGALRRDNTPSPAEFGLYVSVQSCS